MASVGLGALSFFAGCIVGLPAVLLAALALNDIDRSGGTLRGRRLAVAGILCAGLGSLMLPLLFVVAGFLGPSGVKFDVLAPGHHITPLGYFKLPADVLQVHSTEDAPTRFSQTMYTRYQTAMPMDFTPAILLAIQGDSTTADELAVDTKMRGLAQSQLALAVQQYAPDVSGSAPAAQRLQAIASRRLVFTAKDQSRPVTEDTWSDTKVGASYRQYRGALPGPAGTTLLVLTLRAKKATEDFPLSEKEVRRFWESFRPSDASQTSRMRSPVGSG